MEINNKLLVTIGDKTIMEMVYIASTQTQHLFSRPEDIVYPPNEAVLWGENGIGTTSFISIKKEHNFIQLDQNTWTLDIEKIDKHEL